MTEAENPTTTEAAAAAADVGDGGDDELVLQEFDWSGLIKERFFENMLLGVVGVIVGLASFNNQTFALPTFLFVEPFLSAFCILVAFTRVWKTVREEHETMSLWEKALVSDPDEALRDRVFEIPYVFSVMILPFAAVLPQLFMLTLLVFYFSDNFYNGAFARAIAGWRRERLAGYAAAPDPASSTAGPAGGGYVKVILAGVGLAFKVTPDVTGHVATDRMIRYFTTRSRFNVAFIVALTVGTVGSVLLMLNGSGSAAAWLTGLILLGVFLAEWLIEPVRNTGMSFREV